MNESWHIPRPSLTGSGSGSSSSNSSNKSHSNPSTVSRNFKTPIANDSSSYNKNKLSTSNNDRHLQHQQQRRTVMLHASAYNQIDGRRWRQPHQQQKQIITSVHTQNQKQPKRGSHSSQGSSDSHNSSSQSISSGSLLLTAANLERFAEIHKKQNHNQQAYLNSNYNTNLMLASSSLPSYKHQESITTTNKDAVISIDQQHNFDFVQNTKDVDTISMASSTHFTMVNGEGGPSRKTSGGGICSRGKQVTVLITTMSLLFLFVIIGMVYALELRAREMPKS